MAVEIEAKFIVNDRMAFLSLQERTALGEYTLRDMGCEEVRDTYLDTKDRKYMQAGYACRLRERNPEYFITVKSLASRESDIHVRTELEERIESPARAVRPEMWPDGPARELATRVGRGMVLGALCEIRQTRWKREVAGGGLPLLELSLDEVRLPGLLYCLELELKEGSTRESLSEFVKILRKVAPLEADTMSKLEHALDAAGIPFRFPGGSAWPP